MPETGALLGLRQFVVRFLLDELIRVIVEAPLAFGRAEKILPVIVFREVAGRIGVDFFSANEVWFHAVSILTGQIF